MCPAIDNPMSSENRQLLAFFILKMSAMVIDHELHMVYAQNVMSEGTLRQWRRMFTVKSEVVGHLW
jgi:hypothetical protein